MNFSEYQKKTIKTAIYPGRGTLIGLLYASLGLGEAGEIQGKIKKILRDDNGTVSMEKRSQVSEELGDLLWYISQIANELELELETIAEDNLEKLRSRKERGVLQGSGDNR